MKNFKVVTNTRFTVDIDLLPRVFSVKKKRNGKIIITSVFNGKVLFDNLNPNEILIDGNLMQNIEELQNVVFNKTCTCDPEYDDEDYRIFDDSFDETLE